MYLQQQIKQNIKVFFTPHGTTNWVVNGFGTKPETKNQLVKELIEYSGPSLALYFIFVSLLTCTPYLQSYSACLLGLNPSLSSEVHFAVFPDSSSLCAMLCVSGCWDLVFFTPLHVLPWLPATPTLSLGKLWPDYHERRPLNWFANVSTRWVRNGSGNCWLERVQSHQEHSNH